MSVNDRLRTWGHTFTLKMLFTGNSSFFNLGSDSTSLNKRTTLVFLSINNFRIIPFFCLLVQLRYANNGTAMSERTLDYIRDVRLIDDSFFEVFFKDDPKYIEVVIHEIFKHLGHPLVKIQEVSVQEDLNALDKRTVRLDALATDENGNLINIEVQRTVSSVLTKRARYHSALLDTNSLEKSSGFNDLVETYVIFITEKDYRGKGLPAYQVERMYLEDKTPFSDGTHIIFVNGEYRGNDAIGKLMNDFFCTGADQMKNEVLAKRMSFFKDTEEGQRELSGIELVIANQNRAEGRTEGKMEMAAKLIQLGQMSLEMIAEVSGLPIEELQKIKAAELSPA